MRVQTVSALGAAFAIAALVGCNGSIGDIPSGSTGSGAGSGTGNSTGSGAAGNGTAGSGTPGTGNGSGSAGSSGTGTAGTSGPATSVIDLSGTPKYYRAIRLSNTQWAQAIQTVLNTPSGGLESAFSPPATGLTDFSNNEMVLGLD